MSILEAMKQALEALENSTEFKIGNPFYEQTQVALRKAVHSAEQLSAYQARQYARAISEGIRSMGKKAEPQPKLWELLLAENETQAVAKLRGLLSSISSMREALRSFCVVMDDAGLWPEAAYEIEALQAAFYEAQAALDKEERR